MSESTASINTTELIIEHTIAGIQTITWMIFFLLSFIDNLDTINLNFIPETILIALSVSFVYPLGVVIDDVIDYLLKPFEKKIRKKIRGGNGSIRKLLIILNDSNLTKHFDYVRRRIRIARTSGVNLFLLTIALCLFLNKHNFKEYVMIAFISGIITVSICFTSWYLLTKSFYEKMAKRYSELNLGEIKGKDE